MAGMMGFGFGLGDSEAKTGKHIVTGGSDDGWLSFHVEVSYIGKCTFDILGTYLYVNERKTKT